MDTWSLARSHQQASCRTRFEWGLAGAASIAQGADIAIVVDVLSFMTTLSVALDAGTEVLPYRWNDESAVRYAAENDAVLAVGRNEAEPGNISLSARTIRDAPPVSRLVLPSPNGSSISYALAADVVTVLGVSLRNADAVAAWTSDNYDPETTTIAVIAAGEQWPNGGLRPAVEDLWGAGAILEGLHERGWTCFSPEANAARVSFVAVANDIANRLQACASGRELIERGYPEDVEIAAEHDQSRSVPILRENRFVAA